MFGGMESVVFESSHEPHLSPRFQLAHDSFARGKCLQGGGNGSYYEYILLVSLTYRPHGDDESRFPSRLVLSMQAALHWKWVLSSCVY